MAIYYDFFWQCPGCLAKNGYDSQPPRQWYHANCGGKIQIGDNAYYRCLSCGHSSHVKNWRYANNEMSDDIAFDGHFGNAIFLVSSLFPGGGRQWLITLLENLGDDW